MDKKNNKISNVINKLFFKKIVLRSFFVLVFLFSASGVLAQTAAPASDDKSPVKSLLETAGDAAKYNVKDVKSGTISLASVAGGIIQIFLSVLGVIFIALLIYGGYIWMNARGNMEQVTKAQDLIKDAVIGIVIVTAAYAITYFVLFMLAREYVQNAGL
ncbi:MAG: hypothetical protein WC582_01085 [Patescibacteria group bacterium]